MQTKSLTWMKRHLIWPWLGIRLQMAWFTETEMTSHARYHPSWKTSGRTANRLNALVRCNCLFPFMSCRWSRTEFSVMLHEILVMGWIKVFWCCMEFELAEILKKKKLFMNTIKQNVYSHQWSTWIDLWKNHAVQFLRSNCEFGAWKRWEWCISWQSSCSRNLSVTTRLPLIHRRAQSDG